MSGPFRVGARRALTAGQIREAKRGALDDAARAYVGVLETGRDPSRALQQLGAASVAWRTAERAADSGLKIHDDEETLEAIARTSFARNVLRATSDRPIDEEQCRGKEG